MATIIGEELLPLFGFSGDVTLYEDVLPHSGSGASQSIIQTSQTWHVKFTWTTTGPLNGIMAGKWKLQVLLEKMGGGETNLPTGLADVAFVSAPNAYEQIIDFAAGSVKAGLYRVTAIMTMTGTSGQPGPIAGFADLGLVQWFDSSIP
jgi:hypothetical protein